MAQVLQHCQKHNGRISTGLPVSAPGERRQTDMLFQKRGPKSGIGMVALHGLVLFAAVS